MVDPAMRESPSGNKYTTKTTLGFSAKSPRDENYLLEQHMDPETAWRTWKRRSDTTLLEHERLV